MWPALFRGNVCIYSDKISKVSAMLGGKCTARFKVNQKHEVATIDREFKFRKRMAFSVLGSLLYHYIHEVISKHAVVFNSFFIGFPNPST